MSRTNAGVLLTTVAVLTTLAALAMGQSRSTDALRKWEYGQYIVSAATSQFRWIAANEDVSETGASFRLFKRLGMQLPNVEHADQVLWNHLGQQGWEFVGIYSNNSTSITVFRRELKP